jgi:hypothetical protein
MGSIVAWLRTSPRQCHAKEFDFKPQYTLVYLRNSVLSCVVLHASGKPEEVTYCQLIKAPHAYVGKEIRVRAIYRYGFEVSNLDPPECCVEEPVSIWVEAWELDPRSRRLFRRFQKGMGLSRVVFTGVLESSGPFGAGGCPFRLTVGHVDAVEATAHLSENPSWAPKNCRP